MGFCSRQADPQPARRSPGGRTVRPAARELTPAAGQACRRPGWLGPFTPSAWLRNSGPGGASGRVSSAAYAKRCPRELCPRGEGVSGSDKELKCGGLEGFSSVKTGPDPRISLLSSISWVNIHQRSHPAAAVCFKFPLFPCVGLQYFPHHTAGRHIISTSFLEGSSVIRIRNLEKMLFLGPSFTSRKPSGLIRQQMQE